MAKTVAMMLPTWLPWRRSRGATVALSLLCAGAPTLPGQEPPPTAPATPAADVLVGPLERPLPGDRVLALERLAPAARLAAAGAVEAAFDVIEQALRADPACAEALVQRARLRLEEGPLHDPFQGLHDARLAAQVAPDDPAVIATEGLARFLLGDSERARPLLERAAASPAPIAPPAAVAADHGTRSAVVEALGFLALRRGEVDVARAQFEASIALRPNRAWSRYGLAMVAGEAGDLTAKLAALDAALALDGHLLVARHERAQVLARLKRSAEAATERRIAELLRELVDDTSARFERDHVGKARRWLELAQLLGDTRSWARRWRELALADDHATVASEGSAQLAAGRVVAEIVIATARAQARLGEGAAARATAARLSECQPPPPPELGKALTAEIERLERAAKPAGGGAP